MHLSQEYSRYLRLLGFEVPPAGFDGLQQLVLRQVCRIPFENVSKLLLYSRERNGRVTTFSEYLDGIEHFDLGGTCYTANPYFAQLLAALGYDVDLWGASMMTPNVHTCIRVRLNGAEYHVDVGFAAPFRSPMRVDQLPAEIRDGSDKYIVSRSEETGEITVGVYSGRERTHGYRAHNTPRGADFFRQTIIDSYQPGKTFMVCLRVARYFERGSAHLRDGKLIVCDGEKQTITELRTLTDLKAAFEGPLRMPRCPFTEAVAVLEEMTGRVQFPK